MDDAFGKRLRSSPRNAACGTDRVAGRRLIVFQAIKTEVAFDGGFPIIIVLHGSERTGFQALFAADAQFFIDENQAHFIS